MIDILPVEAAAPVRCSPIVGSGWAQASLQEPRRIADLRVWYWKGKYYHPSEFNFKVKEGMRNLYENNGLVATSNQQLILLAGSTFGGGSTVNWSALS